MPSTMKPFVQKHWTILSLAAGLVALVVVSMPSLNAAPPAQSEREITLSSLSKPGLPMIVLASPSLIQAPSDPVTLTATIESSVTADHVTVTWALPPGVQVTSGQLAQVIAHIDPSQSATASISVTILPGVNQPILVNALFAHGSATIGNGATISIGAAPVVQKRPRLKESIDQRIFE